MKSWISGNSRNTFFRIRSLMVSRSSGLFQLRTGDAPGFLPWSRFGHFHNFQRTPFSGFVCLSGQNVSITLNCLTLARKCKEVRVSQYCVPWVLHNICNHCNGWPKTAPGGSSLGGGVGRSPGPQERLLPPPATGHFDQSEIMDDEDDGDSDQSGGGNHPQISRWS